MPFSYRRPGQPGRPGNPGSPGGLISLVCTFLDTGIDFPLEQIFHFRLALIVILQATPAHKVLLAIRVCCFARQ